MHFIPGQTGIKKPRGISLLAGKTDRVIEVSSKGKHWYGRKKVKRRGLSREGVRKQSADPARKEETLSPLHTKIGKKKLIKM